MGSSGGGGSSKPPNQPTPSGAITGFGQSTPFNPQWNSVLSDNMGWADIDEVDAANAGNAQAAAARAAAPPPPQAAAGGGMGDMNAFAQQVLDARKNQQMAGLMYAMDPRQGGQYMQALQSMPKATNPAQQLMLQALQQRQGGGGSRLRSSR